MLRNVKTENTSLKQTFVCLLFSGDRLLEVDGVNFSGLTYQQAVESLSQTDEVNRRSTRFISKQASLAVQLRGSITDRIEQKSVRFMRLTSNQSFSFEGSLIFLQVVGLVVERESANLPRVSVSAESSSIMSNQSLSPARRHLRLNSSSTISNSPSSTSKRTRDFSFVTDGEKFQYQS